MTSSSPYPAESGTVLNEVLRAMLTADPRDDAEQIAAAVVRRLTEVYPAAAAAPSFVPVTLTRGEVSELVANLVAAGSRVRVGVDDGFKYDVGWGWSAPIGTVNG